MQNTDASIIARFLDSAPHLKGLPVQQVQGAILRCGRPFITQLTANGHDLADAIAMLRKAFDAS